MTDSQDADPSLLELPDNIYPDSTWAFQKASPKTSLEDIGQAQTARQVILNLIELIHWASFPLGFWVMDFIFVHADKIAPYVGGDLNRVFLLILGLSCQVFGGGISGNLMHEYEGWQVAPFRNLLGLEESSPPSEVRQVLVPNYNNAWLRAVAYQMLFSFQTLGLGCFTMAVFGISVPTLFLVIGSVAVALLGPREPRTNFTRRVGNENLPVLPLSWSLLIVFAVNAVFNLYAYRVLFGDTLIAAWPPTILPWLQFVPTVLVPWFALLAPLMVAAGGAYEGWFAESSFNQWQHFIAFTILMLGLGIHGLLYWHMVF
ncbi:MAG TPA: hypothetical protein V6D25_07235 [Leptolyngbyaceae cyanobacterium]